MAVDFERLVDGFVRIADDFADLGFLDRGGTLDLRRRVPGVTSLRIELPGDEYLNLVSVIIDADGLDDPRGQITATASSVLRGTYATALEEGRLVDPQNTELALLTKSEHKPWVEFNFDHPVDLRRVTVRNRNDEYSIRCRGIQVLVRTEDGRWSTIYDGVQREREFIRAVERRYGGDQVSRDPRAMLRRLRGKRPVGPADPVGADVVRMLTSIQLRDYPNVFKDLARIDLADDEVAKLRTLISDKIVSGRELEWTTHGIKRSFRFWSEQEKKDYLSFANEVINCLRQLNDNVCFGFGSVLAVVRDHELIPHDDDIDLLIGFEPTQASSLAEARAVVKEFLTDAGYVVTGKYTSLHWVFPPGRAGQKVDVFVGLFEGEAISWYPARRGALTRSMMFPTRHLELLGQDCAVPHDPEQYLEQIYGPGWRTPDTQFRHPWNRAEYLDIVT